MYYRICPQCKNQLSYTLKNNRNRAEKQNRICVNCTNINRKIKYLGTGNPFYGKKHTYKTLAQFKSRKPQHVKEKWFRELRSKQTTGANNPIYGTSNYEIWVQKHGKEKADELNANFKNKLSQINSGSGNPMFGKPSPHGAGNGWSGWYNGWFFRSIRELSYVINVIEKNKLQWIAAESANLKISYIDWAGVSRNYIADFLIEGKYLVEIKPTKLMNAPAVQLKKAAAEIFCSEKGLKYVIMDSPPLSDTELLNLFNTGRIKFTDKYHKLFMERYK